jgi:hypothetical protein
VDVDILAKGLAWRESKEFAFLPLGIVFFGKTDQIFDLYPLTVIRERKSVIAPGHLWPSASLGKNLRGAHRPPVCHIRRGK